VFIDFLKNHLHILKSAANSLPTFSDFIRIFAFLLVRMNFYLEKASLAVEPLFKGFPE